MIAKKRESSCYDKLPSTTTIFLIIVAIALGYQLVFNIDKKYYQNIQEVINKNLSRFRASTETVNEVVNQTIN